MIQILSGLFLGLLSGSVIESLGHRFFGHPSPWQRKLYLRYPRLFAAFLRSYYQHFVIHHHHTFKHDVLTQFESAEEKRKLDDWIARKFSPNFAQLIWKEQYNLTLIGVEGTLPFALPFLLGPLLIGGLLGPMAAAASLATAFTPVLMSKFIHPLIHRPEEIPAAPWIVRKIAGTRYMQWIFHNHFLHHRHMNSNYNLLLGGDFLVGRLRRATREEKLESQKLWKKFRAI